MPDAIVLKVNGQEYTGWTEVRVTRALNECASSFDIAVTERWADGETNATPWQIKRFDACTITIGGQLVFTGYVDSYEPAYNATGHTVRIAGRSKTCDLVDCMPEVTPGEYDGYKLDQIARGIAGKFGLDVVVDQGVDVGDAFPTVVVEPTETGYAILEKLARLRAIILTDDENGALVLTQAGNKGAAGSLIEGDNILFGSAKISGAEMFSQYVVLSQTPLAFDDQDAQLQVIGKASDGNVPRYRRHAEMAENPLDTAQAQARAEWRAKHQFAISTEATIGVQGFRQTVGGDLWALNETSFVKSPRLDLDGPLLIGKTEFFVDDRRGTGTQLTLAPPAAFTPEPDPKVDNSGVAWQGATKITGGG